ncbi:hypothetical protein ACC754_42655, partial [Rhizobium johnstonii]
LSYFTCNPVIAHDMANIFKFITGYGEPEQGMQLAISPYTMRSRILRHIEEEVQFYLLLRPSSRPAISFGALEFRASPRPNR